MMRELDRRANGGPPSPAGRPLSHGPDGASPEAAGRSGWAGLSVIVGLGVLTRLGIIAASRGHPGEVFEYDALARSLLTGHGYAYVHLGTPYRMFYSGVPYVWLTAGLYAAFPPGFTAMLVAQAIIAGCLATVCFLIGRRLWSPTAGLLAAALTTTHPALAFYDVHKLHPLGFDTLLTSLVVLALLRARDRARPLPSAVAGLLLAVAILQRGSLVLLWPLGAVWLWCFGTGAEGRGRRVAAFTVGVALLLGLWEAANYWREGITAIQTTTAEHFWVGNVPYSSGGNLLPSGQPVLSAAPASFRQELFARDAAGQSALFAHDALTAVRAHPGNSLLRVLRKFGIFWTWGPQTGVQYPRLFFHVYAAYYVVVLALAAAGTFASVHRRAVRGAAWPGTALILATLASVSVIHSVFFVELRHRWGVEPLLLVLASIGCFAVAADVARARRRAPTTGAAMRR